MERSLTDNALRSARVDQALWRFEQELRRAERIEDANLRRNFLTEACVRWSEFDPADALRIVHELGLDDVASGVFEDILQKWAEASFDDALAWARRESAGEQRDRVMTRLAFLRAETRPENAARLVAAEIPAGPTRDEAGIAVLHQWALRDLAAATRWADRFPPELQERAHRELAVIERRRFAVGETN